MNDNFENINAYDPKKKLKIMIVFDNMVVNMLKNEKFQPVVTVLCIRGRKLNMFVVFIAQSYFAVTKNIRLNSTHYFTMKIQNKQ